MLVVIFAFMIGVASTAVWITHRFRPDVTTEKSRTGDSSPATESNWIKVDMDGRFSFFLPADLKQSSPIGDYSASSSVQEFRNGNVQMNAGYSESGNCHFTQHAEESVTEIDGKKAILAFDRSYEPKLFISSICFEKPTKHTTKVWISITYKKQGELDMVNQVFRSIRFQ